MAEQPRVMGYQRNDDGEVVCKVFDGTELPEGWYDNPDCDGAAAPTTTETTEFVFDPDDPRTEDEQRADFEAQKTDPAEAE